MESSGSLPQYMLRDHPEDSISALKFIPNSSNLLLSSSWDGSVRLYELTQKKCIMKTETKPPILSCAATVI